MRPLDLSEAVKERPIAWLVVSPLEWHGEALSFGCDPHVAQTVTDLAWEKTGGVRIPTMYLGVETDYEVWEGNARVDYWGMELGTRERNPGSLYLRPLTLELVLRDYLYFLQREGFKLCVIVSGHGAEDHLAVIRDVCSKYDTAPMRAVLWYAWGAASLPRSCASTERASTRTSTRRACWAARIRPWSTGAGSASSGGTERSSSCARTRARSISPRAGGSSSTGRRSSRRP